MNKEEKIYDAGPVLTYKHPLSESDFKHFHFEEKSLENLVFALNQKISLRFAIYCILEKTENSSVWYVFMDPSLPSTATPEQIISFDQFFGKNNWVKPETKALTGIVHQELKSHALIRCMLLIIRALIRKGQYEIGLSCFVENGKIIVVNRSTMQYSLQKIEELPKYANYYSKDDIELDAKNEQVYGGDYTLQFVLERSTELFILKNFAEALNDAVNQYQKNLVIVQYVDMPLTIDKCWNIKYLIEWEETRRNKQLLGEALLRTIYVSASLKVERRNDFWPKERDSEVATRCIQLALAQKIFLDLNQIPYEFRSNNFRKNILIQACRKKTSDAAALVVELIEQGADIHAWDGNGRSVLYYANINTNKEIYKYLYTIDKLIEAIKSSDEKGIKAYLDPNVIMIDRPINKGMTALAMAAAYGNLDAVLTVIKILNANNIDLNSSKEDLYLKYKSPLLAAAESGSIGKVIVLFCAGVNPAELNLDDICNEEIGIIEAWSNPELLRTALLDPLIKHLIDLTVSIDNGQDEKGDYAVMVQKLKKAIIRAQKVVKISNLASECYWKEIDSLARCALNLNSHLQIMNSLLNGFMDCISMQDLVFSSKVKFPEFKVTQEDEDIFDKEIAKLKLQTKAFEKLINNETYWKASSKGNIFPLFSKPNPNLVLIRKMQNAPILSLNYYKGIVQCNRVPRSKKLKKFEDFYAAIFKSQSFLELLESKPVQEILQEQAINSSAYP